MTPSSTCQISLSLPPPTTYSMLLSALTVLLPLITLTSSQQLPPSKPPSSPKSPPSDLSHSCPSPPSLSCPPNPNTSPCCAPTGGLLMLTQFWDSYTKYHDPTGPAESFTLHGLWPDNCDGSYESYCDAERVYNNVTDVMRDGCDSSSSRAGRAQVAGSADALREGGGHGSNACADADALLEDMRTYWLAADGNNPRLWAHEWNKHGTCISTLAPRCYAPAASSSHESPPSERLSGPSQKHTHEGLIRYFALAMHLFHQLPTYSWLCGDHVPSPTTHITPSRTTPYKREDIAHALSRMRGGVSPVLRCGRGGELKEVWYYFLVKGDLRGKEGDRDAGVIGEKRGDDTGDGFVPTEPPERGLRAGNCPQEVWYLPKEKEGEEEKNGDADRLVEL